MKLWFPAALLFGFFVNFQAQAQAHEGTISEAEIESLREAAYIPTDRILVFEKILNTRAKRVEELMAKRRHPGREQDLHDLLDQFAGVTDEFIDNLEEYRKRHRDVRKMLPKLLQEADRWSAVLQAPVPDENYNVVRKLALDNLKDLREEAVAMGSELDAYFKEHPEALTLEKERMDPARAHAPQ